MQQLKVKYNSRSREKNPKFVDAVRELETSPVCQSLNMQSFLMLPMQRITRLPLLMEAIHSRLAGAVGKEEVEDSPRARELRECREALERLNKVNLLQAGLSFGQALQYFFISAGDTVQRVRPQHGAYGRDADP